jgi:hypothetical protein
MLVWHVIKRELLIVHAKVFVPAPGISAGIVALKDDPVNTPLPLPVSGVPPVQ